MTCATMFLFITVTILNFINNLLSSIVKLVTLSHVLEWLLWGEKELECPAARGSLSSSSDLF